MMVRSRIEQQKIFFRYVRFQREHMNRAETCEGFLKCMSNIDRITDFAEDLGIISINTWHNIMQLLREYRKGRTWL